MRNRHWSSWLSLVLALGVLITPGLAAAGPLLTNVGATWSNPVGTGSSSPLANYLNPFNQGSGNSTIFGIRWGTPYYSGGPQTGPDTSRSGLGFDPFFPPASSPSGTFTVGNLWHFNNQIWNEGFKLTSVDLTLTATFDGVGSYDYKYHVDVDETYNKLDPCPYGGIDGEACDDKITLAQYDTGDWTFNWGGDQWKLTAPDCGSIISPESTSTPFPCTARLSTVPNPSTLLFIGLGLVGLIGLTKIKASRR